MRHAGTQRVVPSNGALAKPAASMAIKCVSRQKQRSVTFGAQTASMGFPSPFQAFTCTVRVARREAPRNTCRIYCKLRWLPCHDLTRTNITASATPVPAMESVRPHSGDRYALDRRQTNSCTSSGMRVSRAPSQSGNEFLHVQWNAGVGARRRNRVASSLHVQ